jgi:hypothetical protein
VTRIEPELWVDGAQRAVAFSEAALGATTWEIGKPVVDWPPR